MKHTEANETKEKVTWADTDANAAEQTEEDTVKCAQCDIHLPRNEAIIVDDMFFCSNEHRRQYQDEMEKKTGE